MREKFLENMRMWMKAQCSIFSLAIQTKVLSEKVTIERMGMLKGIIWAGFSMELINYDEYIQFAAFAKQLGDELEQEIQDIRDGVWHGRH